MASSERRAAVAAGERVEIRSLDEASTAELVACVRRCYGTTYPESDFLDESALAPEVRSGRLVGKVAVTHTGRVVGHLGTRFEVPGDAVADTVAGFVDPECRGSGLLRDLGAAMYREYRQRGIVGLRNYATGAHTRTQSTIVGAGGRTTGILLGHIPAGTEYRGIEHDFGSARIGAVVYYQPLRPAPPLRVAIPERWCEIVASIFEDAELDRTLERPRRGGDPMGSLRLDPRQGLATIRLGCGEQPLDRLLDVGAVCDAEVTYVDVPLAADAGDFGLRAVDELAGRGFVFGALLPGSRVSEVLRLQRVAPSRIAPERIQLASPAAAAMLAQIVDEIESTGFGPT